jgi:hypothetical protein
MGIKPRQRNSAARAALATFIMRRFTTGTRPGVHVAI